MCKGNASVWPVTFILWCYPTVHSGDNRKTLHCQPRLCKCLHLYCSVAASSCIMYIWLSSVLFLSVDVDRKKCTKSQLLMYLGNAIFIDILACREHLTFPLQIHVCIVVIVTGGRCDPQCCQHASYETWGEASERRTWFLVTTWYPMPRGSAAGFTASICCNGETHPWSGCRGSKWPVTKWPRLYIWLKLLGLSTFHYNAEVDYVFMIYSEFVRNLFLVFYSYYLCLR